MLPLGTRAGASATHWLGPSEAGQSCGAGFATEEKSRWFLGLEGKAEALTGQDLAVATHTVASPYCDAVATCALCVKALSLSHQCHTSSPPQPDLVWAVHRTGDLPEALSKPPAGGKPYRKPSHLPTDVPKDIS